MRNCSCGADNLSPLEVVGIVTVLGVALVVVAAPYVLSAGVGGGLLGAGAKILTHALLGQNSSR